MSFDWFEPWARSQRPSLSPEEARFAVECLLALPISQRLEKARDLFLDDPETLIPFIEILRERLEADPSAVRADAEYLYGFLQQIKPGLAMFPKVGKFLFDQREYFLGESALIAGSACRDLSLREEARQWFRRADQYFVLTVEPAAGFSRVQYERLALMTEERRFEEVLELLPPLLESFGRLGAKSEALKCRFLEGQILRETGQLRDAVKLFQCLVEPLRDFGKEKLLGSALVSLVQLHAELGEVEEALSASQHAAVLLERRGNRVDLAKMYCGLGLLYRNQRNPAAAIEMFRTAQREFRDLLMRADIAALNLVIADLLLELGRDPEARWEIQAALPVIHEYQLVPEGIAALSLLQKSLQGSRLDRDALRNLHGYFRHDQ